MKNNLNKRRKTRLSTRQGPAINIKGNNNNVKANMPTTSKKSLVIKVEGDDNNVTVNESGNTLRRLMGVLGKIAIYLLELFRDKWPTIALILLKLLDCCK